MSTEQENFDDLLRSKLGEGEFAFNEANWDKAEALIIAADKKRKRRRIIFIFFIGLILGVCVMIPFINKKENTAKKNLKVDNKVHTGDRVIVNSKQDNRLINNNINTGGNNKKVDQGKIISEKNKDVKTEIVEVNKDKLTNEVMQNKSALTVKPATKVNKASVTNDASSQQQNNEKNTVVTETKKSNIAKTTKTKKGRAEEIQYNAQQLTNNTGTEITKESEAKKENAKSALDVNEPKENNSISQKADTTGVLVSTKNDLTKDTIVAIKDSVAKTNIDSVNSLVNDSSIKIKQGFVFGIDAGANYCFGWKNNNNTKEAAGFNGVIGLSATHFFSKRWSILLGVQYNSLAHLNYSNYTFTNLQYGFGYNQTQTTITTTIVRYIAVPIKMQYWFNNKNSLSVGINILYQFNANSKVETTTTGDFSSPTTSVTTKAGYEVDFSTWGDIQPALAYKHCFKWGIGLNFEAYYGLNNVKTSDILPVRDNNEHNYGCKLTISYVFIGRNRSVCGMKDYIK